MLLTNFMQVNRHGFNSPPESFKIAYIEMFYNSNVGMVLANTCHRQNIKTSIINGSEVSRLSVAIQFTITSLARTTDLVLTPETRRNVQKCVFFRSQTGCFGVAGLLSESQIRFQSVCRLKTLFLPELP